MKCCSLIMTQPLHSWAAEASIACTGFSEDKACKRSIIDAEGDHWASPFPAEWTISYWWFRSMDGSNDLQLFTYWWAHQAVMGISKTIVPQMALLKFRASQKPTKLNKMTWTLTNGMWWDESLTVVGKG